MKKALIVFTKNPVAGRVKTRLAKAVGDDRALAIHIELAEIVAEATRQLPPDIDLHVFYGDSLPAKDPWEGQRCTRRVQLQSPDLGKRMFDAFQQLFKTGYESVVIIGTDCPYIDAGLLITAFEALDHRDLVIGPALDGGFYLLGVKDTNALRFDGITWSTASVYRDFIEAVPFPENRIATLKKLEDIDDLKAYSTFQIACKNLNNNTL